jgi:sterol 3beta-glucosyltransferase
MPDWTPTADLLSFLAASKTAPFLLTLGSCVVADPAGLSIKIAEAAALAGVRIILQQGWAKLGIDLRPPPKHVFVLGPAPHSWLFPRCAAVIHHGGAGTTCAGLLAGLPTLVLPFFGDQPFWGEAVRKAGCGPPPLKANTASIEDLAAAFGDLLRRNNEMKICAQAMGAKIAAENGVDEAVKSFYRHLPVSMQCDLSCGLARVYCQDCDLKLSPVADVTIHAGAFRAHVRSPWRYVDYSVGAERATTLNAALAPVTLISSTIWAIFRDGPSSGAEQFKRVHEALSPVGSHSLIVQPIAVGAAVASGASRTVGMALWAGVVFLDKVGSGLGPEAKHIEQPQSVVQGLFQGLDRFTRGVWSGVTAPVTDTLHATAQNHYPWNIVGGACKGLANLVVQPLAGTLQLVSRPLMGITNQFKAKSSLRVGDDEVDQVSLEIDDQTRKVIVEKFVFTHFALTEGRKLRVRLLRGQNYQI